MRREGIKIEIEPVPQTDQRSLGSNDTVVPQPPTDRAKLLGAYCDDTAKQSTVADKAAPSCAVVEIPKIVKQAVYQKPLNYDPEKQPEIIRAQLEIIVNQRKQQQQKPQ